MQAGMSLVAGAGSPAGVVGVEMGDGKESRKRAFHKRGWAGQA